MKRVADWMNRNHIILPDVVLATAIGAFGLGLISMIVLLAVIAVVFPFYVIFAILIMQN